MTRWGNAAWLLALPMLIGTLVFSVLPAMVGVGLSLFRWSLGDAPEWTGGGNYARLAADGLFRQAALNTCIMALVVPVQVAGSYILALLLRDRGTLNQVLRLTVFLPTLVNPIALFVLWRWIYQADYGLLARLGGLVGIAVPAWLEDPIWAKPALMVVMAWESVGGFTMLFFLAAFRQIPVQIHEMANLDGVTGFDRLAVVYWPWTRHVFGFCLALGYLAALHGGFEIAYAMTGGGPLHATTTLAFYAFETAFELRNAGYAAAIGVAMALASTPLIALRVFVGRRTREGAQ
jgi:multiple sugar transport system permease protein